MMIFQKFKPQLFKNSYHNFPKSKNLEIINFKKLTFEFNIYTNLYSWDITSRFSPQNNDKPRNNIQREDFP